MCSASKSSESATTTTTTTAKDSEDSVNTLLKEGFTGISEFRGFGVVCSPLCTHGKGASCGGEHQSKNKHKKNNKPQQIPTFPTFSVFKIFDFVSHGELLSRKRDRPALTSIVSSKSAEGSTLRGIFSQIELWGQGSSRPRVKLPL